MLKTTNSNDCFEESGYYLCTWVSSSSNEYENALLKEDAGFIITHLGSVRTDAEEYAADFSFLTSSSVLFDAVYIPHGLGFSTLLTNDDVMEF
jgi:hypothetical protein